MLVFGPFLLLMGEWPMILLTILTATVGVTRRAAALQNCFFWSRSRFWERALLFAAAFGLIKSGLWTDTIGAILVALALASQFLIKPAVVAALAEAEQTPGG